MKRIYMLKQVAEAQEEERKRIARDLHDGVAQTLVPVPIKINHLMKNNDFPENVASELRDVEETVSGALREIRCICTGVGPGLMIDLGLIDTLTTLVGSMRKRGQTIITLNIEGNHRKLPKETEQALFRIAQESLNNIWKHAEAKKATLKIAYEKNRIFMSISDDGKGFDTNVKSSGNLGLRIIRERARLLNADLRIDSANGKGTTISVTIKK